MQYATNFNKYNYPPFKIKQNSQFTYSHHQRFPSPCSSDRRCIQSVCERGVVATVLQVADWHGLHVVVSSMKDKVVHTAMSEAKRMNITTRPTTAHFAGPASPVLLRSPRLASLHPRSPPLTHLSFVTLLAMTPLAFLPPPSPSFGL